MTTIMGYFNKIVQQLVQKCGEENEQKCGEENENRSFEKKAFITVYNINNYNGFNFYLDEVNKNYFFAILCKILDEVPQTNNNSDSRTTKIYLNSRQIQKVIESIKNESDKVNVKIFNAFKKIA